MMTTSDQAVRFSLWPLPDLRDPADGSSTVETVAPNEYEAGYAAGYEEGRKDGMAAISDAQGVLREAARGYDEAQDRLAAELHPYITQLATAIARHVIQREVTLDEQIIIETVKRILETVEESGPVRVRMNPDDLACTEAYRALDGFPAGHEWIADASMERGSCVIESPDRVIDGTIDAVLDDLAQRLAHA